MRLCLGFSVLLALVVIAPGSQADDRMIYGVDDRREVDDPANDRRMVAAARGTGIILSRTDVRGRTPGVRQLTRTSLQEKYNLCASEPFGDQPAPGLCSAFLVAPDLMVTAAHCVLSATACANIAVVFDFKASVEREDRPDLVKSDDVYLCRSLVTHVLDRETGLDFALIRLDRPAYGRPSLDYRTEGWVDYGDKLTIVGHPAGLPLKITSGGKVRDNEKANYFVSDLDTFVGSSGAPVINDETGLVEGFVARGDRDWTGTTDGCRVYHRCAQDGCRGEDIIRMSAVLEYLPRRF